MAMPTSPVSEVAGFPRDSLKARGFQSVRKLMVTWADRYEWAKYFFYEDSQNYPYFAASGIPTESAITKIGIEPVESSKLTHGGLSSAQAVYEHAYLTMIYESAQWDNENVFIEELTPQPYTEHIAAPYMFFQSGISLGNHRPTKYVAAYNYRLTYPRRTVACPCIGNEEITNADIYHCRIFNLYINRYCGLYLGSNIEGTVGLDGTDNISVTHNVLVRKANWNMEWNPYTGQYEFIFLTGSGTQMVQKYNYGVFNTLLR